MTRFTPSKHFLYMGLVAVVLGLMSGFVAWQWTPAVLPAVLFFTTSIILFWLCLKPMIEITDRELAIGPRVIPWSSIIKIETTSWFAPLVLKLTLESGCRVTIIYAGDPETSARLKDVVCNCAPHAMLDGVPQRKRQATIVVRNGSTAEVEKHAILTVEDEAEVERMFQRLREVGNLDSTRTPEDR